MKRLLMADEMRREFLGGIRKNEAEAVKAFVRANAGNALKTKPKGYGADHENIELLRLRNFTVGRKVEDAEITGPKGMERVLGLLSCIVPFVTHLNSVVMPDGVMEDSDSDEGSSEEASETDSSGVDDE
ncbi:hypothetical protein LTR66_007863 [Elasticomyces elasticus]|nr:hypothetical protein LTR66_007863 [Elasticomyces elasticus]